MRRQSAIRFSEPVHENAEPTLISKEKVKHPCKCWYGKPTLKLHTKEVFSDGWTKWTCSECGKIKFRIETKVSVG